MDMTTDAQSRPHSPHGSQELLTASLTAARDMIANPVGRSMADQHIHLW
jgi:hypothetical protein